MKKIITILLASLFLASCSVPKCNRKVKSADVWHNNNNRHKSKLYR